MRGERYLFMRGLCMLPEWQGNGVGRRLLEWGLEIADWEGVECWIDASAAGLALYRKLGWKEVGEVGEVGEVVADLGEWGGKEGHVERVVQLVRPRQSREG